MKRKLKLELFHVRSQLVASFNDSLDEEKTETHLLEIHQFLFLSFNDSLDEEKTETHLLEIHQFLFLSFNDSLDEEKTETKWRDDLKDILQSKDRIFVLFYASWCPFSQRFLPVFEKFAQGKTRARARVVTDDKAKLCEEYSVEVVPTVLVFEKGKIIRRLDGVQGIGLSEKQLMNFVDTC